MGPYTVRPASSFQLDLGKDIKPVIHTVVWQDKARVSVGTPSRKEVDRRRFYGPQLEGQPGSMMLLSGRKGREANGGGTR